MGDFELTKRWLAGDKGAGKILIEKYFKYALMMTGNCEDSEQITVDAFQKVKRDFHSLEGSFHPEYYLFKVFHIAVTDYFADRNEDPPFNAQECLELALPEPDGETRKDLVWVLQKLRNVNKEMKESFILKEIFELSYNHISTILNIQEETARSRKYRVLKELIKLCNC